MIDLPDMKACRAALCEPLKPALKALLSDRLADTESCDLAILTHILVIEAKDTEADVIDAVGFSPLASRIDGNRDQPDWDWLERHEGFWEALYCVGDSGFAFILLIEDADQSPFAQLCRKGQGE
jgi:hypothetical protein